MRHRISPPLFHHRLPLSDIGLGTISLLTRPVALEVIRLT